MKKIGYFISVLLTCMCLNRNVQAFAWPDFTPLIPFAPQFCVMCIPPAIDWAYNTVDQVKDAKNRLKEMTDVSKIKQAITSYAAQLGTMALNYATQKLSARKKVISSARTILASQRQGVDINKEDSVKVDFVNLFLQYPSTKSKIKEAYRLKGEAIKTDTALEMFITASEMMKELCGKKGKGCELASSLNSGEVDLTSEFKDFSEMGMVLQISLVEQCFMQGEYCSLIGMIGCEPSKDGGNTMPSSSTEQPTEAEENDEDKVCHWKTALQVARMYDKIMRYNEMLVYMQAQYDAIMGIDRIARIRAAKEEKGAFLMDKYLPQKSYHASQTVSSSIAFADENLSDEDLEEFAKYEKSVSNRDNVLGGNFESMDKAQGFESVLDDKVDDIASLQILENVKNTLDEAKTYHNMKQMLPDYQKTYKNLHQAREYHDKTVEYLQKSGECVKNYLEPHYQNPAKAWFGDNCDYYGTGMIYCHYSPEKSMNDVTESKGIYDDACPDDSSKKCYIQKIEDSEFSKGIAGALLAFYTEGKIADALQETETYLKEDEQAGDTASKEENVGEVTEDEDAPSNSYTKQVNIGGGDYDTGDKETYVTERDDGSIMDKDNANTSEIVPSAASTQQTVQTERDDKQVDEKLKDFEKSESLAEETRKGHLMNWIWGATMANIISDDLDSAQPKFGVRKKKFPLWNDQKEFYYQYLDSKYRNIGIYMDMAALPGPIKLAAQKINEVYGNEDQEYIARCWYEWRRVGRYSQRYTKCENGTYTAQMKRNNHVAGAIGRAEIPPYEDTASVEINRVIQQENANLQELKETHERNMAKMLTDKEILQNELAEINKSLDKFNEEFNQDGKTVASGVNTDRSDSENKEYNQKLKSKYKSDVDMNESIINKKFAEDKTKSDDSKGKALNHRIKTEKEAKYAEQSSKNKAEELRQLKEKIEAERREFVKKYSDAEENSRLKFNEIVKRYSGVPILEDSKVVNALVAEIATEGPKASEATTEPVAPYGKSNNITITPEAATLAGKMVQCIRGVAKEIVANTYKFEIEPLLRSGAAYYKENAGEIQRIHSQMINNLKTIPDCKDEASGVPSEPIAEVIFNAICGGDDCKTPEISKDADGLTNYFVGGVPVTRDFKSPTPPLDFSSAPVREIFHFDISDYDNIKKYYKDGAADMDNPSNADITITAESFLQLGKDMGKTQEEVQGKLEENETNESIAGTFPTIWKYVLRRHTYVQKQFDLTRLLGDIKFGDNVRGDPVTSFLRSGSFPCYIGNDIADVTATMKLRDRFKLDLDSFSYKLNNTNDINSYSKVPCQGLFIKDGKVYDFASDGTPPGGIVTQANGEVKDTSELGNILSYVPDAHSNMVRTIFGKMVIEDEDRAKIKRKLTFNTAFQKAVNILSSTEELGKDQNKDARFHLVNRAFLNRNQFGDYLDQVEQEAIAREALAKVENQIEEIVESLRDVFYGTSIVLSDDFDLLKDSDYKEAADALDEQKRIYLTKAENELKQVKGVSDTVKNKVNALLNTIALLYEDEDEVVKLNGTEDLAQLRAKIDNQKADNAVVGEYEKMGNEAHEKRIRQLQLPYCEVHLKQ